MQKFDNAGEKCILLVRGQNSLENDESKTFYLGTTFLEANYVYFNAETKKVSISETIDLVLEDIHINHYTR